MRADGAPEELARRIRGVYGQRGLEWLARLPETVAVYADRWALQVEPPFAGLSYNYVAPALRADGTAAVLKLGVPNPELRCEAAALRMYDGRGAVHLLDSDPEGGALLLERLAPGALLSTLADDVATEIAAGIMRQLWRPLPRENAFPDLQRWLRSLFSLEPQTAGGTGPLPAALVARAQATGRELIASPAEPVVLHGDLHHFNILSAGRKPWLAIDPKGLAGEPAFDTGTLLLNPIPAIYAVPNLDRVLARRIAVLADMLGFDHERIRAWAFVQAVLSACWTAEDHGSGWEGAIFMAEQLAGLRP